MLNQTPLWKYLVLIFIVGMCALYATPNLYGEDYAVQISAGRNASVDESLLNKVTETLSSENIEAKNIALDNEQILVRLTNSDSQLIARETLQRALGDDYYVAMNLAPDTPAWLEAIGGAPMKLGLDLRGGVHFLMEVDMNSAVNKSFEDMVSDFRSALREEGIRYRTVRQVEGGVEIFFRDQDTLDKAEFFLRNRNRDLVFTEKNDLKIVVSMSEQKLAETRDYAVKQNITIIRNRVNQLGVAEPSVQKQGVDRIAVQLPGIQDTARAKEILNATATLEFRSVDLDHDVRDAVAGRVPAGSELVLDQQGQPQLLKKKIILTGNHIIDANSSADEYGIPQVNISLDSKGGSKMSQFTKDSIGKPMATVFIEYKSTGERDANDKLIFEAKREVISIATIQARLGSSFRITGLDSPQEAHNLSLLLRAGALIAPIQIVEERTVGPSLGKENIALGTQAIIWGFVAVLIFMLIYYKAFGVVANLALTLNLVMIVGIMSMIPGATLSLPGMAGIVLTVGMAVDANVLIFERIREELREGRSPQQAIHHGYDSAFSTILDANITTFIAGLILFAVGTGPIKGFSITLMIGIATSMFTAIFVTRAVVNAWCGGKPLKKLSI
ncbi:protein translocase subunit SecD [Paraglaciecola chathamensis]|uniref:Protein translocase subunit SecD n=3 Tax=Paraglaciecola chathamensis TaxID=368405 RepID=A0A8H9IAI1_9ALTE|nr:MULTISPECIES: protein translocase subunit SecD [Paraglaciecola]AEE24108.1 protein-export membrane protein SecD [Glaciecola sp. 4H-3-7+YE-5]MBN25325.1 protein translocase subunit SecD [Alteromonadaceae bacterium]MBJ2134932.1 protein translocase subunit SecD [Paraglaciecola chathamensis]MDO6558322.1 protein translocase subunit SecD [Paraglaciecola chathamensis]MDO6838931.1 protein translocase subunit SecD [Paraglaciecola chathamensis]